MPRREETGPKKGLTSLLRRHDSAERAKLLTPFASFDDEDNSGLVFPVKQTARIVRNGSKKGSRSISVYLVKTQN
jgi:hypothetical protein